MRRTTVELDEELLRRAQRALGSSSIRGTIEEALRRTAAAVEADELDRRARQRRYLAHLRSRVDLDVLASQEMWR
jgi:Arc/MetJ family transcription regulator